MGPLADDDIAELFDDAWLDELATDDEADDMPPSPPEAPLPSLELVGPDPASAPVDVASSPKPRSSSSLPDAQLNTCEIGTAIASTTIAFRAQRKSILMAGLQTSRRVEGRRVEGGSRSGGCFDLSTFDLSTSSRL